MENSTPRRRGAVRLMAWAGAASLALAIPGIGAAAQADDRANERVEVPAQFEQNLGRGLAAATTDDGVFVSWRLLGSEATGATDEGMTGPDFALYRDGERIATVTDSTNFLDPDGTDASEYTVAPIVNDVVLDRSDPVTPWGGQYASIPIQKPEGGRTPAGVLHPEGEEYTYAANDMSVADVDGDGQYEYVVKWYPSNAKDVSQRGYTGNTIIDTYEADGTLLHRIDLGVNVRSGAHYTQFMVEDFDGDGRAEIMLKTAPGTTVTSNGEEAPITLPADDIDAGVTNDDDYRLSADEYADHLAGMLRGWADREEVTSGQWPATVEAALGIDD
ncbi:MAG: rhamnogalacturonan lyase, partial [Candidatus Microbacterium stercoravium]